MSIFKKFERWAANLRKPLCVPPDLNAADRIIVETYDENSISYKHAKERLIRRSRELEKWMVDALREALRERSTCTRTDFEAQLNAYEAALEAVIYQRALGDTANAAVSRSCYQVLWEERSKILAMVFNPLDEVSEAAAREYLNAKKEEKQA